MGSNQRLRYMRGINGCLAGAMPSHPAQNWFTGGRQMFYTLEKPDGNERVTHA